jgi:hypothetical protein
MALTHEITNDETNIKLTLVIDGTDQPIIRSIRIASTDDRGVRENDLLVLERFGLRLPRPTLSSDELPVAPPIRELIAPRDDAVPDQTPAPKPRKKTDPGKGSDPGKKSTKDPRPWRKAPPDWELILDYNRYKQKPSAMAEAYDVPAYTVQRWLKRLRDNGSIPRPGYTQDQQQEK